MAEITWLMPLLILPGVALLIVSTSARYAGAHDEVHHLAHDSVYVSTIVLRHLRLRGRLFRDALTALYACVAVFAIGSIAGAIAVALNTAAGEWIVFAFTCVGIASLITAAGLLIRESTLSFEVIEEHLDRLESMHPDQTPGGSIRSNP